MHIQRNYTWDEYFMSIAHLVSMKSKDISTRVGAVIVGQHNEIRATGYNGFPEGVVDSYERYANREYKYLIIIHAEESAILQCARMGVATDGCKIYVPWIPCCRCATSIIQSGIKEVIYDKNFPGNHEEKQENWKESINLTREIMHEGKVLLREFDGNIIKISNLYKGKQYDITGQS